jgi:hypothetical protein
VSHRTTLFSPGDLVLPGSDLCNIRPELVGESGKIEEAEGDEVLVQWDGLTRLYRVMANMLEMGM